MKTICAAFLLTLLLVACSTIPRTTDRWIIVSGVDRATGHSVPISVIPTEPSLPIDAALAITMEGIEQTTAYPKWRYDSEKKTVSISHTNETFEARVVSPGYEPADLTLERGFSGPVTVFMRKQ